MTTQDEATPSADSHGPPSWRSRIVGHTEADPGSLQPHPLNWRGHPAAQSAALSGVLEEVGWVQSVVVNRRTGRLIDGHLRVELAQKRGERTIPVVEVDLSEEEEALILASLDPIAALATANAEKLEQVLALAKTQSDAVKAMLEGLATRSGIIKPPAVEDPGAQIDRAEELRKKWGTERGQVWQVGRHRLMCGDAGNAEDVGRLMGGEKAGTVLTDPPYGMNLDTDWSAAVGRLTSTSRQRQTRGNTYDPVLGDDEPFDPSPIFDRFGYCPEIFMWGADYYAERIPDRLSGSWMVWDKRKESQADAIGSEFELLWSKAHHKRRILRHDWFGFLSSENQAEARGRVHPTQKPSSLFRDILQQWCRDGGIVVDPFLGSGTTMVAAEQLGRTCFGMDISPAYIAVSLERMAGMGLKPVLVDTVADPAATDVV